MKYTRHSFQHEVQYFFQLHFLLLRTKCVNRGGKCRARNIRWAHIWAEQRIVGQHYQQNAERIGYWVPAAIRWVRSFLIDSQHWSHSRRLTHRIQTSSPLKLLQDFDTFSWKWVLSYLSQSRVYQYQRLNWIRVWLKAVKSNGKWCAASWAH